MRVDRWQARDCGMGQRLMGQGEDMHGASLEQKSVCCTTVAASVNGSNSYSRTCTWPQGKDYMHRCMNNKMFLKN